MQFDREKFKTLVVYIAWKAGRRDWFGATKLNKVLWFAEARAFVLHGQAIVGATYIRQKHGPVPKQFVPVREELKREKRIKAFKEGNLERITAETKPDMSRFTLDEMQLINYWIDYIDKEHTAASISEQSHDYGWEIASMNEEIPLYAVLAERIRVPSDQDVERLRKKARAHGLV